MASPRRPLADALAAHGLRLAGGFVPADGDAVPPLPDGRAAGWLAMAGVGGSSFWPVFDASPERRDGAPDPLDRWSRRLGDALAAERGGAAVYPFDGPPHAPFQRWGSRAEGLSPSPLGLQLHPVFGLWHSYRFALALPEPPAGPAPMPDAPPAADACARCLTQPCLHACPVEAFDGQRYDVPRCLQALRSPHPPACRDVGCLARHACPVGAGHAPVRAHARFLMQAFVDAGSAHSPEQRSADRG